MDTETMGALCFRYTFKAGNALDPFERGVRLEEIMYSGAWSSKSTALKYLASWVGSDLDVFEENRL